MRLWRAWALLAWGLASLGGCRTSGATECPHPGFCVESFADGGCQVRPLVCCLPDPETSACQPGTETFVTDAGSACAEMPFNQQPKCL